MDDVEHRLNLAAIIRPATAEDIQDESHCSLETVLIVNNLMRVLGELSEDRAKVLSKEAYALIRKYDDELEQQGAAR